MTEASSIHVYPIRVYYEDTDAEGIVYYANYLKFAERGRTEMLRAAGIDHTSLWDAHGVGFAVRSMSADYLKPAKLDDALTVHSRLVSVRGASMSAEQVVKREREDLVHMSVRLACIDRGGKPARFPKQLRLDLDAYIHDIQ